jgi:hypothetical protein
VNKDRMLSELILPRLQQGEELIGYFQAQYRPSTWWQLLTILSAFAMRIYCVGVTNRGIHLQKLNLLGKPDKYSFYTDADIVSLQLGSGTISAPLQLSFTDGTKIKLYAQLKGAGKVAKLDDRTKDFLTSLSSQ